MDFATVVTPPYVAKPLRLLPFRAVMLSAARVGDAASARAFARPYRAVGSRLRTWERRGYLSRDPEPAVYLHEYSTGGLTVRGLVGGLDIANRARDLDSRAVWPHEGIHPAQVAELADRMGEMGMNPAPILLVHAGPSRLRALIRRTVRRPPDWQYVDRAGQQQRIWAIRDPVDLDTIDRGLATSTCLIADGHHRYAAYLQLQQDQPGTPWDRGLAMVVDQLDSPLFLGAIHRSLTGVALSAFLAAARRERAVVRELPADRALAELAPGTIVATDKRSWASVVLPPSSLLPVEWLHGHVVPTLAPTKPRLGFHHSMEDALAHLADDAVAVLLPAPDFDQVRAIIRGGRLLPEKATSFQPKPSLGVLMRSVGDE